MIQKASRGGRSPHTHAPRALILGVFALLAATSTGCPPAGRYASCDNDSQCGAIDGGTCESLDSRVKEEAPPPPPTSLEECAKRCKGNSACSDSCREQFK
jgi:hypothetical protein